MRVPEGTKIDLPNPAIFMNSPAASEKSIPLPANAFSDALFCQRIHRGSKQILPSSMKTIPTTFRKNGYDYTLLERVGNVAIYEQAKGNKLFAYEVVKIRVRKAGLQFGKVCPEAERLPADEEWGMYGKTYSLFGSQVSPVDARNAAKEQMRVWVAAEQQKGAVQVALTP